MSLNYLPCLFQQESKKKYFILNSHFKYALENEEFKCLLLITSSSNFILCL